MRDEQDESQHVRGALLVGILGACVVGEVLLAVHAFISIGVLGVTIAVVGVLVGVLGTVMAMRHY